MSALLYGSNTGPWAKGKKSAVTSFSDSGKIGGPQWNMFPRKRLKMRLISIEEIGKPLSVPALVLPSQPLARDLARAESAEMRMLLACCQRAVGTLEESGMTALSKLKFDDSVFLELCRQHRLTPVIRKVLMASNRDCLPRRLVHQIENDCHTQVKTHLMLCKWVLEIHKAFRASNLRYVFLKGPLLNQQLYDGELQRHSGDLDVLIEASGIFEADVVLRKLGYEPVNGSRLSSPLMQLRFKDISYRKPGFAQTVELHWKTDMVETILVPGMFEWESLTTRLRFQQESIPILSDYHNCLYLCLHASKHHWSRIRWLLDIPLLIQKRGLDRNTLLTLAVKHGLQKSVLEAFFWSQKVLNLDYGYTKLDPSGKNAIRTIRRSHLNSNPEKAKSDTLELIYRRGLLYPGAINKVTYWLLWGLERFIFRFLQAKSLICSLLARSLRPIP